MKKLALVSTFVMLVSAGIFAQGPDNLNWVPGGHQSGSRADPDIYLQGTFVEIGIHASGSCGTESYGIPAGYHSWYTSGIGFVADFNMDGWENGTPPKSGDYFLPGAPFEGWLVEFTYQGVDYGFANAGAWGYYQLPGYGVPQYPEVPQTSLTNTSSGSVNSALWIGTATGGGQSLLVRQNFHFDDSDAKFMIDVTLTNTGSQPLQNVEYARVVDPDQEQNLGGTYTTVNYVGHQPDGSNNLAQVVGNGPLYGVPMALQMIHPNAKAHVVPESGRLYIESTNEPLDLTNAPPEATPYVADVGLAVATRIPVLGVGQSVTIPIAYVLNADEIINPPGQIPLSNWALALMIGLIVVLTIIRFRKMN